MKLRPSTKQRPSTPMSIPQAVRKFQTSPRQAIYVFAHGSNSFENFLSSEPWEPESIKPLNLTQTRAMVRLWIRINAAKRRAKGPYAIPFTRVSDVTRRLALVHERHKCIPNIPRIFTPAYWETFVIQCADFEHDLIEK